MGATREDFSTEWMTYSELRTVFATAARRLGRSALVPAVHRGSHGPEGSD